MLFNNDLNYLKFNEKDLNFFLQNVPDFFHHIFAFYDNVKNKWIKLKNTHFKSTKSIKILPNVLFNCESTLNFVLHFLSSDVKIYRFFVIILIQEYEPSYMIEIFPFVIVIYYMLMNNQNKDDVLSFLRNIFRMKDSMKFVILINRMMKNIQNVVTDELMCKSIDELIIKLSKNMITNIYFQTYYSRYLCITVTLNHLQVNNDMFNWNDISNATVTEKEKDFYLKIEMNDLFSDLAIDLPMKNEEEANSVHFILLAQMDLVHYDHCSSVLQSYHPRSCTEQHWNIQRLIRDHQPNRLTISYLSERSTQDYMGDSFLINFIPLSANKYACLKVLHKVDKLKDFWGIWFRYQDWHHPFILKCYGLFKESCGFFRECADGPLFFNVYKNNQDFLFRDVLDVLYSIGSALDYLHRNLGQVHGNVNLKSIVRVGKNFKLSEASISESNSEVLEIVKYFDENLEEGRRRNPYITDVYGLLLSIILIYFMNEDLKDHKVSQSSFRETKCLLKELILKAFQSQDMAISLLENLYKISVNFTDSTSDEVIVQKDNIFIPKCIEIYNRDAKIFQLNEIKPEELQIEKTPIGRGNFSTVFKAKYSRSKDNAIAVAAKWLNDKNDKTLNKIKTELFPSTFPHKNVLKSYGYCILKDQTYLISELAFQDLLRYLQSNQLPNDRTCINFCLQVCQGMKFLSDDRKFIHRDLAARNILVFKDKDENVTLKISDFGLTIKLKNKNYYNSNSQGNFFWLPDDEFKTGKFTVKTDIYSYGVVMWEIFSGGKDVVKMRKSHRTLPKEFDDIKILDGAYNLMKGCWSVGDLQPNDFNSLIHLIKALLE